MLTFISKMHKKNYTDFDNDIFNIDNKIANKTQLTDQCYIDIDARCRKTGLFLFSFYKHI